MAAAATSPSPVYPLASRVNERGVLEIGGCDAVELAREFGTPAYVLAADDLTTRARAFTRSLHALHPDGEVLFASKALPCLAIEQMFSREGLGVDVASGGELAIALAAGFDAERIYLHGNANSDTELQEALDANVGAIVIDNLDELAALHRLAPQGQDVLLRVTPGVAPDTHAAISTGQADSKFGVSLDQAPEAIERIQTTPGLQLKGLHLH